MFSRLAEKLNNEGKKDSAIAVIDKMLEILPDEKIPYSYDSFPATEQLYRAGAMDKANKMIRKMYTNSFTELEYYLSLPENLAKSVQNEQNRLISHLRNMIIITRRYNQTELNKEIDDNVKQLIERLTATAP
jgi:hypothetical protein